jgi:hypothetical protein
MSKHDFKGLLSFLRTCHVANERTNNLMNQRMNIVCISIQDNDEMCVYMLYYCRYSYFTDTKKATTKTSSKALLHK